MKHINRINNEITNINKGNKIKVRLRKTKSGFSIYLDLFSKGKRQREWLEPKLSGNESDWEEDKSKILFSKHLRNIKEQEMYQNHHNFKLIDKSDDILFIDYYIKITETKNKVNKTHWKSSLNWFKQFLKEYGYSELLTLADIERENPLFKETIKIGITPLLFSLSLLNSVEMNSEIEILGYGTSIILLNLGMYFVAPTLIAVRLSKR